VFNFLLIRNRIDRTREWRGVQLVRITAKETFNLVGYVDTDLCARIVAESRCNMLSQNTNLC
jgi:hypothetical protein